MTRKALEKFDPKKLRPGHSKYFEVRNKETGFGEFHCFHRDRDGELFFEIAKPNVFMNHVKDRCKLKQAKLEDLKQTSFLGENIK